MQQLLCIFSEGPIGERERCKLLADTVQENLHLVAPCACFANLAGTGASALPELSAAQPAQLVSVDNPTRNIATRYKHSDMNLGWGVKQSTPLFPINSPAT